MLQLRVTTVTPPSLRAPYPLAAEMQRANSRCEASKPLFVFAGHISSGRVAATHVQGSPKGGGALWRRGVSNTRLFPASLFV